MDVCFIFLQSDIFWLTDNLWIIIKIELLRFYKSFTKRFYLFYFKAIYFICIKQKTFTKLFNNIVLFLKTFKIIVYNE